MGYISEVCFGIQKEQEQKMDAIIEKHFSVDDFEKKHYGSVVAYHNNCVKWYGEVVEGITAIIEENGENFCIALGEDGEEHSKFGDWWDYAQHESYLSW